jgi:microcin C transport system substrate-binding protein
MRIGLNRYFILFFLVLVGIHCSFGDDTLGERVHALSLGDIPKYGPDFKGFSYANLNAPKGGEIRWHALGTFDNFNPFTMKGRPSAAFYLTDDSLAVRSLDEPYTVYGLIAESMQLAKDNSRILFHLHPDAKFHDGTSIKAEDVVFSFEALISNLSSTIRIFFQHVERVNVLNERTVEFSFSAEAPREMPLIVASLQVYPRHWWSSRDLSRTTLDIPVGSGPYKIASFDQGRNIVYQRVDDYWAQDLPVRRGLYNFDHIRYEYFMDDAVAFESFKAGLYDIRRERSARNWKRLSSLEGVEIRTIEHSEPRGIEGFFFNIRRKPFDDPHVRKAISLAFDWDWINRHYLYNTHVRCNSFFTNSDLSGFPLFSDNEEEMERYDPFNRENLLAALDILNQAGWHIKKGRLVNSDDEPMRIRILTNSSSHQRMAQPWISHLKRLGIESSVQLVDSSQFVYRMMNYEYDVIASGQGQRIWPGMEIRFAWHSQYVKPDSGGRNLIGLMDPEVDALVESIIAAETREELRYHTRTLDRLLMSGNYVIPLGVSTSYLLALRHGIGIPEKAPGYGLGEETWWSMESEEAEI